MRIVAVLVVVLLGGCAPSRYAVVRPELACDRAIRVTCRTLVEMGYAVTEIVEPHEGKAGVISGTKTGPDGVTHVGRVQVQCDATGVALQPIEEALIPNYDFSRLFGYSFKSLVQRPDVEEPAKKVGLQVLIHALRPHEAHLDLGGLPTIGDAVTVRVTVRNNTDRAVAIDPARLELARADGSTAHALTGSARAAVLASGDAADRVRTETLTAARIPPHTTLSRFLVFSAGPYREARLSIEDVETGESDGFVTPVD